MPKASARVGFPRHPLAWALVFVAVVLAHAWLGQRVLDSRIGAGAADRAPKALSVSFVKELAPTLPPVAVAPAAPPPRPRPAANRAAQAAAAASAASAAEPDPALQPADAASAVRVAEAVAEPAASSPAPLPETLAAEAPASAPPAPVLAAAAAASAASAPVGFDWPPSTQLNYRLTGHFRGPLHGQAQVQWLRQGERYQVRLEVKVDPIVRRRMLSDGVLGDNGLSPRRYDEETEVPFKETRRATVRFEPGQILLANGKTSEPTEGVQDAASQFVQLTWLFLTRPDRLQVGRTVDFPLALPRRVGRWTYDVAAQELLQLPFGEIQAFRLAPRRDNAKPNELSVEMWIAPTLQYLPVRIQIRQDAETFLDLQLESRPLQAGP
jgi:Protein of unknown function (DUF3108)